MSTDDLRSKAVIGAGVNVIAQFSATIFQIIGVIALGRLLTPSDFGLVAIVTAFSSWFANFGENGFAEYIIQKRQINWTEINSIFWLHVFVASTLAIVFTLFGAYLVVLYSEPKLWGIGAVISTSFVLGAFCTTPLSLLKREMAFSSIALVGLLAAALSVILAIAAAAMGMSYWAVVVRQVTIPVTTVIGAWALCPWRPKPPRQISRAIPGLKYALQVYVNYSLGYLVRNVDKILLGRFHGTDTLGNYDRAYYLSMMPVGQLLTPLNNVALATLSQLTDDRARFIAYYTKAVTMVSFLGTAISLVLTISANDIILLLLGPQWNSAGPVVRAFGPGMAGMLVYGTNSWLHLSLGTPNRWLRWNIFSSIVIVAAFVISARWGAVAMAFAYSITAYMLVVPALWYAGRPIGFSVTSVISALWPYFVSAVIVSLSWVLLCQYWPFLSKQPGTVGLALKILLASVGALSCYLALVILFQTSLRTVRDCVQLVGIFLDRR